MLSCLPFSASFASCAKFAFDHRENAFKNETVAGFVQEKLDTSWFPREDRVRIQTEIVECCAQHTWEGSLTRVRNCRANKMPADSGFKSRLIHISLPWNISTFERKDMSLFILSKAETEIWWVQSYIEMWVFYSSSRLHELFQWSRTHFSSTCR